MIPIQIATKITDDLIEYKLLAVMNNFFSFYFVSVLNIHACVSLSLCVCSVSSLVNSIALLGSFLFILGVRYACSIYKTDFSTLLLSKH